MVETKSRRGQHVCCCCCRIEERRPKATSSRNLEGMSTRVETGSNCDIPKRKVEVPKCCRHECICQQKPFHAHKVKPPGGDYIPLTSGSQEHHQNEIAVHYEGEKCQNLINKLKIYLDQLDDR